MVSHPGCSRDADREAGRPNLLFVFADQMRSTALGCAGIEKVKTPNFDLFARQGTRFTNAISNTPACTPARASLLTGLHAMTHGLIGNDLKLNPDLPTIADSLNGAGYKCGYIGKVHLDGPERTAFAPPGPKRHGFNDFWAAAECNHRYSDAYYYLNDDPEPRWFDSYEPDGQTDLAIDYIRDKAKGDDPFCLFLSWGPPHCPYRDVPQRYLDMYPPEEIEYLPGVAEAEIAAPGNLDAAAAGRFKRETIGGYYAHVTALDACFGRLLNALDGAGIAGNTIVVFTSDHGDMLFSQNRGWKSKPWRESVGIPLLVRWPGHVPERRVANGPIGLVDMMPTLLSMLSVKCPDGVEGKDLTEFVLGDEDAAPESQWIGYPSLPPGRSVREWRGVVTSTHTYVRFRDQPWLLYDDSNDSFQQQNLVQSTEHAQLRQQLEAMVQEWLEHTNDPFEDSNAVADKYCPGHVNNTMPYTHRPDIVKEQQRRWAERNA